MCQIAQSPSCADLELLPRKKAATRELWVEGLIVWDQVAAAVDSRRQHLWFQWSCRPCRIALSLVSLGDVYISGSFMQFLKDRICSHLCWFRSYPKITKKSCFEAPFFMFPLPCSWLLLFLLGCRAETAHSSTAFLCHSIQDQGLQSHRRGRVDCLYTYQNKQFDES